MYPAEVLMDPWWTAAALMTLVTAGIHTFVGGAEIARPLLAATDLRTVPKLTSYYCWHLVTIVLFAMAAGFGWSALSADAREIGQACTLLSGAFGVWSLTLIVRSGVSPKILPQWALFLPILVVGAMGGG
jgi:hypothetical protein